LRCSGVQGAESSLKAPVVVATNGCRGGPRSLDRPSRRQSSSPRPLSFPKRTGLPAIPDRVPADKSLCRASRGLWPMRLATSTTGETSRPTNDTRPVLNRVFTGAPQRAPGISMRVIGNSRTCRRSRLTTAESQILREGVIRERARRPRLTTQGPVSPSSRFPVSPLPPSRIARTSCPCNTRASRFVPSGEPDASNPPSLP
jgi:hypothetical protein